MPSPHHPYNVPTVTFSFPYFKHRIIKPLTSSRALNDREGYVLVGWSPSFQLMIRAEVEQFRKVPRRLKLERQRRFVGKPKV